jgi:hypothetical protein
VGFTFRDRPLLHPDRYRIPERRSYRVGYFVERSLFEWGIGKSHFKKTPTDACQKNADDRSLVNNVNQRRSHVFSRVGSWSKSTFFRLHSTSRKVYKSEFTYGLEVAWGLRGTGTSHRMSFPYLFFFSKSPLMNNKWKLQRWMSLPLKFVCQVSGTGGGMETADE